MRFGVGDDRNRYKGFARRITVTCCQFGRVVKASDSKSDGVTRVGSNPAADVSFFLFIHQL